MFLSTGVNSNNKNNNNNPQTCCFAGLLCSAGYSIFRWGSVLCRVSKNGSVSVFCWNRYCARGSMPRRVSRNGSISVLRWVSMLLRESTFRWVSLLGWVVKPLHGAVLSCVDVLSCIPDVIIWLDISIPSLKTCNQNKIRSHKLLTIGLVYLPFHNFFICLNLVTYAFISKYRVRTPFVKS